MKTDAQLRKDVLEQLIFDPSVTSENIKVSANAGIVTLSGKVPSYADKVNAELATFRVAGVRGVAEDLEVKLPSDSQRSDQDIAKAAVDILSWTVNVSPNIQ